MVGKKQRNSRRKFLKSLLEKEEVKTIFYLGDQTINLSGVLKQYNPLHPEYFLIGEGWQIQIPINCVEAIYNIPITERNGLYVNLNQMYNIRKSVLEELAA